MTRRTTATVVGVVLLLVAFALVTLVPLPYVVYSPGPTVNLLGKVDKREIVQVEGDTKVYRDDGDLRLLTVSPTGPDATVNLAEAMAAWISPSRAVYRYRDIYQADDTADQVEEQGQVQMVSSQDAAVATALTELGYDYDTYVQVLGIQRGGPGDGSLEVRDRILAVDGTKVNSLDATIKAIQDVPPGQKVSLRIVRGAKTETVRITTTKSQADPEKSALLVTIGPGYSFPVDVKVRVGENIGGPSAGMMFSLAIYDTLTPGSLTGGSDIAGTGTIDENGNVGPIGGIQQKLSAAQDAGAKLFLAPADNCDEVRGGPYDEDTMRVLKVKTFHDAVSDVTAWRKDHDAKLPAC